VRKRFLVPAAALAWLGCGEPRPPLEGIDAHLLTEISKIRVIDNHGHPLKLTAEGEKPDEEYDALTFEEMEPFPMPVRIRADNHEYIGAWRLLWDYRHTDMSEAHVKEVLEAKQRRMRELGDGYPAWVLDRLGIETMLANRIAMGRGLAPPRFRWVSYVDALMLPLSNERAKKENPDYRSFYRAEERLLRRYLAESGVSALPGWNDYLAKVVTATLERHKAGGAVAVKFEAAYLRALDFDAAAEEEASRIYARYASGGEPLPAEYKTLQDFLFRYIARECGRLGLAVHIHSCAGAGGYYKIGGTNPLLLDPVVNDPALRKTSFVLVHGGWPFTREAGALLAKPNVYADFSALNFVLYPRDLAQILRTWLEYLPEKVLYGGDVEPFMPQINWEETGWLTVTTGRQALAMALTGMMADGEIARERALEISRLVLRENAARLYGLRAAGETAK